jgi:hypothetical protein
VLVPIKHLELPEIVSTFGELFGVATDFDGELQVTPRVELEKLGVVQAMGSIGQGQPGAPTNGIQGAPQGGSAPPPPDQEIPF